MDISRKLKEWASRSKCQKGSKIQITQIVNSNKSVVYLLSAVPEGRKIQYRLSLSINDFFPNYGIPYMAKQQQTHEPCG